MPTIADLRQSRWVRDASAAWTWWTGELAGMIPERLWRRRPVPTAQISLGRDRVEIERIVEGVGELYVDERPIDAFDEQGWAELASLTDGCRTRLLLRSPAAYATSIQLPKAAQNRVKAALALQLPQISPIDPDLVEWAARTDAVHAGHVDVGLAMARRRTIDGLQCLFVENGLDFPSVDVEAPEGPIRIRAGADGSVRPIARNTRRAIVAALALVATIPFTTFAGARLLTSIANGRADVLEREVQPRIAANRRARQAELTRRALRPVAARPIASAAIEEVAAALPATAYLRSAEQAADRSLTLTIDAPDAATVEAAVAGVRAMRRPRIVDQTAGEDGRMIVVVRAGQ
jgi:hypothetical protein